MTDATVTEPTKLWFLLDRSGSMSSLTEDVIGGFNAFIAEQAQEPGSVHLTLVQFDTQAPFEIIHNAARIEEVPPLTTDVYRPRGTTPLLDAIGDLIQHADRRIEARSLDHQPAEDQLVVIFSDGLENASHHFDRARVAELISKRQEAGWEFVFMGANQDSYLEAGSIGVLRGEHLQLWRHRDEAPAAAFAVDLASHQGVSRKDQDRTDERFRTVLWGYPRGGGRDARPRRLEPAVPKTAPGYPQPGTGGGWADPLPVWGSHSVPCLPTWDSRTSRRSPLGRGSGLVIEELPASTVPFLGVTNPTNRPCSDPGRRTTHRWSPGSGCSTRASWYAPSNQYLEIPVSCLEQGRWGDRRDFDRGRAYRAETHPAREERVGMPIPSAGKGLAGATRRPSGTQSTENSRTGGSTRGPEP